MNRKNMPLILMLTAGAVTCVISFIRQDEVVEELLTLLVVLVLFYLLGSVLKWTLDYFERQNEEKNKAEGEVIEKEAEDGAEAEVSAKAPEENAE